MEGKPLTSNLNTKVNADMLAYIDSVRGTRSRAGYVRDLIRADASRKAGR